MKRVLLQGSPPCSISAGDRLRLKVTVCDDMGEDAEVAGEQIVVGVQQVADKADSGMAWDHAKTVALMTHLRDSQRNPSEYQSIDDDLFTIFLDGQPISEGAQNLIIQPSRAGGESCCAFAMRFSESLHETGNERVLVTLSVPSTQGILPLIIGPISLMSNPGPGDRRLTSNPAAWSRIFYRTVAAPPNLSRREQTGVAVRLLEQNARDGGIDSSLWDAGLVLGAYLSHMCLTSPDTVGLEGDVMYLQHEDLDSTAARLSTEIGDVLKCSSIIELGCGTGCAGLMLAGAMKALMHDGSSRHLKDDSSLPTVGDGQAPIARPILLSDGSADAVRLAQKNAELNGLCGFAEARILRWGDFSMITSDVLPKRLIFAADVVYDEGMFWPLVETLYSLAVGILPSAACSNESDSLPHASMPCDGVVVLAYRLRTDAKSAEHFWHLLLSRFDIISTVSDSTLVAALSAWGMDRSALDAGVSVYHLSPLCARRHRDPGCLYCDRMLLPRRHQ